ncbi:MAG: hypothetical protein JF887_12035 [Candidatus Dormibacteraeota bacterium]|uniref:Uncharacterized protein n=1 Tax=Candidatus Amunia macphersoniae TaxID=3127014 RepID=A0A934KNG4_9BACT|nr:hypothetical protein [Candidatus Dormibacteraeota bacterium]
MSDEAPHIHEADTTHGEHAEIHLPPNSFVPICVALSLCLTFVGFVDQVRGAVGPLIWGIGLLGLIASCVVWFLAARSEFRELPESAEGH